MHKLIWLKNKPIIGLAPMDGWTDWPFRQICKEHGADLLFSEMIPAPGVIHFDKKIGRGERPFARTTENKSNKFENLLYFSEQERPFVMQIFGKKPDEMAEACRILSEIEVRSKKSEFSSGRDDPLGRLIPDEININFGCPAKSAVSSGHGVALMDNPDLAADIVRRCVESSTTPISVKMRTGWQSADEAVPFAQKMEQAGASAIYIHGRTFKQKYSGFADWDKIYEVAKSVKIPVVGNGDITFENVKSQMSKVKSNGLAGVLIGRAARGNPWIFGGEVAYEKSPPTADQPKAEEVRNLRLRRISRRLKNSVQVDFKKTVLRHAQLLYDLKGEHGIIEFRKHLLHYLSGLPQASQLRQQAVKIISIDDIQKILYQINLITVPSAVIPVKTGIQD